MSIRLRAIVVRKNLRFGAVLLLAACLLTAGMLSPAHAVVQAPISGEIQRIVINNPNDVWSGGSIHIGRESIIIPRNLLIDLPANRLTLQQIFAQAPPTCLAAGQTGLAKADSCNTTGTGGFATISANRTDAGNVIAGDIFIEKGREIVAGTVTFINFDRGFFVVNGRPGTALGGLHIRLNDPEARHTIQRGPECLPGSQNCSPDPRFTLDPDNYTNVFSGGFPVCIPSSVPRSFIDIADINNNGNRTETINNPGAQPTGLGDFLCPASNRTVNLGHPVNDSRRFAPLRVGDWISAEGNYETVNGINFFSAHSMTISDSLTTKPDPTQPDYLFLEEVGIDAPGFQNERARTLFIGFTTRPSDVTIWTIHYDPLTNQPHEFPLASTAGCDAASGGPGNCTQQGIGAGAANIWKIRHDVDFLSQPTDPKLDPCAHLIAAGFNVCPGGGTFAEQFGILSPVPHEIIARTAQKIANPNLISVDVMGKEATNGEYLFPLGLNLGGISIPEMVEIDLNKINFPVMFSGIPWNLDRRLSPGGCIDTSNPPDGVPDCEAAPQPLNPFPFEGLNPRTQAGTPGGAYSDPTYTASALSVARNRIISYVTRLNGGGFNFNGNSSLLAWPPATPAAFPIALPGPVQLTCTANQVNTAPVAVNDLVRTNKNVPVQVSAVANDTDAQGNLNPASLLITANPASGLAVGNASGIITYTPTLDFVGADLLSYTVKDVPGLTSNVATVNVTVTDEVLALTTVEFSTLPSRWTIFGTSNVVSPPANLIQIHFGADLTGPVIGTASVDAFGEWVFRQITAQVPIAGDVISVQSSNGGALLNIPVNVLP